MGQSREWVHDWCVCVGGEVFTSKNRIFSLMTFSVLLLDSLRLKIDSLKLFTRTMTSVDVIINIKSL